VALTNSNLLEQQTASEKATARRKAKGEIFLSSDEIISGIAPTPRFDDLDRTLQFPKALKSLLALLGMPKAYPRPPRTKSAEAMAAQVYGC
jgi:hypothetical protein